MGTRGYFAYRYKGKYYRQYLSCDAYPSWHGQHFADAIPRDTSALKDWISDKIKMLEDAKTSDEEVVYPRDSDDVDPDDLGYELCDGLGWTFPGCSIEWTYVVDLDNLTFTVNGMTHLKLDNMPPSDPGLEAYFENEEVLPPQHVDSAIGLWPAIEFDATERQQKYDALDSTIVSVGDWGTLTWDKLSFSQHLSIGLTNFLIRRTSHEVALAYAPEIREKTGRFCWDVLCAATPALPLLYENTGARRRILSSHKNFLPYKMCYETGTEVFKTFSGSRFGDGDYCWVRDLLITFCVRLSDPAYVAHEVEQMVQKMRHDGHAECVGIILSSQQEMIAVTVDDGFKLTRGVRHTPSSS